MSTIFVYNLAYYDGVMEAVGGRRAFWRERRRLVSWPRSRWLISRLRIGTRVGG